MDFVIFAITTLISICTCFYIFGMSRINNLKQNWVQYRCNPIYMPFAGMVGDNVVSNFTKCTMKGFQDYTGFVMDPLMAEFSIVNETLGEIGGAMNSMRSMMSGVRGGFLGIIGAVFGKIQNLLSQFQYIIVRMRTLLSRVVGTMLSFIYIFYAGMETGDSVMSGPIGKTVSFLCFDPETLVICENEAIPMYNIKIGDKIGDDNYVTSIYRVSGENVPMYFLNGVIVSGSHKVRYQNHFICVEDHPESFPLDKQYKVLVCFNTSKHRINLRGHEFLDFAESIDFDFMEYKREFVERYYNQDSDINNVEMLHVKGVTKNTQIPTKYGIKHAENITMGDILDNGDEIIGISYHAYYAENVVALGSGCLVSPDTWVFVDGKIQKAHKVAHSTITLPQDTCMIQFITKQHSYPVLTTDGQRYLVLDEIECEDPSYLASKDTIIFNERIRGSKITV